MLGRGSVVGSSGSWLVMALMRTYERMSTDWMVGFMMACTRSRVVVLQRSMVDFVKVSFYGRLLHIRVS